MDLGRAGQLPRPQWERDLMDYQRGALDRARAGIHPEKCYVMTKDEIREYLAANFPLALKAT